MLRLINTTFQTNLNICQLFRPYKKTIDYSQFPVLNESDLKESLVRGSGPGGQAVNKTSNCVVLKHIPTGITVKCHEHRSVLQNRKSARNILLNKLDNFYNADNSVEAQQKYIDSLKIKEKNRKQRKLFDMKNQWKKNEGID